MKHLIKSISCLVLMILLVSGCMSSGVIKQSSPAEEYKQSSPGEEYQYPPIFEELKKIAMTGTSEMNPSGTAKMWIYEKETEDSLYRVGWSAGDNSMAFLYINAEKTGFLVWTVEGRYGINLIREGMTFQIEELNVEDAISIAEKFIKEMNKNITRDI